MADLKQTASRINAAVLIGFMLDEPWHQRCEIIPDYMPPYPQPDTRPCVKVRFNDGTDYPPFLRHSKGPKQGYFWDVYGDDMHSIELAVFALSQAPAPRDVGPITFRIPLPAPGVAAPVVPDDVWEALQRMIENAASLGPACQEDALLIARWRGQFVAARERAASGVQGTGDDHA